MISLLGQYVTRFDKCNCKFCIDIIKAIQNKKDMLDDE